MSKRKVHIHTEQFDGVAHAWCGRGKTAVMFDVFEATDPHLRCRFCEHEWFPFGQPDWHLRHAKEKMMRQPPLPTKSQLTGMAYNMKKATGNRIGHCYEIIAKQYGFNTYAAMRVVMAAQQPKGKS